MTREELLNALSFNFEDIEELCNKILDGDYGEIIEDTSESTQERRNSMTKEETARAYANGFEDENYRQIAYDAFLCGYGAKCESSLPSDLDEAAEKYADIQNKNFLRPEIVKNIFKAGAKWMAMQGDAIATRLVIDSEGKVNLNFAIGDITDENCNPKYHAGQDVIVQIREITQRKA